MFGVRHRRATAARPRELAFHEREDLLLALLYRSGVLREEGTGRHEVPTATVDLETGLDVGAVQPSPDPHLHARPRGAHFRVRVQALKDAPRLGSDDPGARIPDVVQVHADVVVLEGDHPPNAGV